VFGTFDISASALTAERVRMTTIASNLANMHSTSDAFGRVIKDAQGRNVPYRRQTVEFAPLPLSDGRVGVAVTKVGRDMSDFKKVYDPSNKDLADKDGYVYYPNVNLATEQINAIEASRAYEANVTAIETTKSMMNATMRLLA
jgi:flagellar basal-body rod protein FlgC